SAIRRLFGRSFDPLPRRVLVIRLLHRAPGNAVGATLVVTVLAPGAVERLLVNVLRVRRQIVAHAFWKLGTTVVGHPQPPQRGVAVRRPLTTDESASPM